ncbi:hypothetical protein MPTK1_5g20390 [Marchantia polymorpha subsp. ruderalis]|uniref:Uncharacterized protein n=2 Tax=Marchantia polymorpha TaxID=3197 RepID=A0AAF6BKD8_MARPO|nr:hypothetical protein MARPO_0058s0017 [Marchantia polymorpha]BBN12472.1 hypothetical protein Mp_5g20390 [Marchantia polymorpha subsp. ruderalis]|eukprot:PTQ37225.1 hypothetical protein MARPO_0058s0017 [Marchantia polymorpha]
MLEVNVKFKILEFVRETTWIYYQSNLLPSLSEMHETLKRGSTPELALMVVKDSYMHCIGGWKSGITRGPLDIHSSNSATGLTSIIVASLWIDQTSHLCSEVHFS